MLKKVIFVSFLLIAIFTFSNKVYASSNDYEYNFNLEKEIMLKEGYLDAVVVCENIYIFVKSNAFSVVVDNNELLVEDVYLSNYLKDNKLYIISTSCLYTVNLNLLSLSKQEIDMNIEDFIYDDYIYIVGNKNNNPCIFVLDESGKILKEDIIIGDGFATYKNIEKVNDLFLITCYKDAFFRCDEFYCVGNMDQMKSLILTVDKTLEIKDIYYFNEGCSIEQIKSLSVMENILLILETDKQDYLYEFNYDLNLLSRKEIGIKGYNVYIVDNKLNETLLLYKNDNSFYISKNNKTIYEANKYLLSFKINDNSIIFVYDNKINIFSEYHIKKLKPLYVDKVNYDYSKTSDIQIESFFDEVYISFFNTDPYFRTLMSGKFNATYEIVNYFGSSYFVNRDIIVRDFVNIIDNGVYNTNTKLSFFGDAYLNDEYIQNGYVLKEPGIYTLKLYDINGLEKTYTFEVICDYYKDNDNYVVNTDYILEKDESIQINFDFVSEDILYFIVNEEKYYDFTIQDECVVLNIKSSKNAGYEKINIDKVVTNNKDIKINEEFTIFTLKDKPEVLINSLKDDGNYIINMNIKDLDNTFIDIYYESNGITNMYMKNNEGILNSGTFYLKYELGDGLVRKEKLFSIKGDNINYSFEINDNDINIKIKDNSTFKEILINNKNIYIKDTDNINLIIIFITICLSIIISCFYLVYFLKERIKHKNINRI